MKTLITVIAILTATALNAAVNADVFLQSIAQVETHDNPRAIGPRGERTQWQITYTVWRQHSNKPFDCNPIEAKRVATAHLNWILNSLSKYGKDNCFFAAIAWHGGLSTVYKKQNKAELIDYAKRVTNVYESKMIPPPEQSFQLPQIKEMANK